MTYQIPVLERAEYLAIEEAIAATSKGRAFLRNRDDIARVVAADQVGQIMRNLQDWIAGGQQSVDRGSLDAIRRELSDVRLHIDRTKVEIADLTAEGQGPAGGRIKGASAELDEIVNATAAATNDILSAAEAVNALAEALPQDANVAREKIVGHCMDIFQACSFQDITGQRIAKVLKTLAYIEQRVNAMMELGGRLPEKAVAACATQPVPQDDDSSDQRLLNGPQLPGAGLGQEAIDALMDRGADAAQPAQPADAAIGQKAIDALFD